MSTIVRQIEAKLSGTSGDVWKVVFNATIAQHLGQRGLDDQNVADMQLATSGIPDGDYMIEYSDPKPFRGHVRVKNGVIVTR